METCLAGIPIDWSPSLAHHYPRDICSCIREEEDNKSSKTLGNDGLVRAKSSMPSMCSIPQHPLATSPLDYCTTSEHWVKGRAGVRGWLVARQVVRWLKLPPGFEERFDTLSATDMAQMAGISPDNAGRLAGGLAEKGYAEKTSDGQWRLRFREMFRSGEFCRTDDRQTRLRVKNRDRRQEPRPEDKYRMTRQPDHYQPPELQRDGGTGPSRRPTSCSPESR